MISYKMYVGSSGILYINTFFRMYAACSSDDINENRMLTNKIVF